MKTKALILLSIFAFLAIIISPSQIQAQDTTITYHKGEKLYGKIKSIIEIERDYETKFLIFQKKYDQDSMGYQYNNNGKLIEETDNNNYNYQGKLRTLHKYDERNNKTEYIKLYEFGQSDTSFNKYDMNNNLIEKINPIETCNYKYDNRGNVIEVKGGIFKVHLFLKYNEKNKIEKIESYYDNKLSSTTEMVYINNKNQSQELTYTDSILTKERIYNYKNDSTLTDESITEYYANKSENIESCNLRLIYSKEIKIYQKDTVLLEIKRYKYDEEGNVINREILKYDDRSRLIYSENRFKNQAGIYKYINKYNDRDELIEQTSYTVNNPIPLVEKYKYKYDKKGNWIEKIIKDKYSKGIFTREIEYYE